MASERDVSAGPSRHTKSNAERQRDFRKRKVNREKHIAMALARLLVGQPLADQTRLVKSLISQALKDGSLDDDQQRLLDRAIDVLSSKRIY